jgi:hypothetical protein
VDEARGSLRNPEEGERPTLEAATGRSMMTVTEDTGVYVTVICSHCIRVTASVSVCLTN